MKKMKSPKIIAITNQKGGVGKTATAINLGASLAHEGFRVLIIDIDPQANASTGLGFTRDKGNFSSYNLFFSDEGLKLGDMMQTTSTEGLKIIPASSDLSSVDLALSDKKDRLFFLKKALRVELLKKAKIDFVLLDCPPSLNLLSLNALVAAQSLLVPLQAEFFALEGLSQLLLSVRKVREKANKDLRVEGILLTMFDGRNRLACQVEEEARENLGPLVFQTKIPRNVRISESPSYGQSIFEYDKHSKGAVAYGNLAKELTKAL